jgi:VWFA-related protein
MYKKALRTILVLLMGVSLLFSTGFSPISQSTPDSEDLIARITQVDTSRFPKVTVYVSVTDAAGEPVGVSPSRLVLQENGVPVEPDEIGGEGEIGPLTTLLVMDISGSMNAMGKLQASKEAAIAYVDQSRPQDFVGLESFNTRIEYVQPLTSDHQDLIQAIEDLKAKDDTAFYDALAKGIDILGSTSGRKAIIALTDGMDNRSKLSPQEVIQMIGPEGLSISIIGLGDPKQTTGSLAGLNEPALKALAAEAGGLYAYASDAESLRAIYELYGRAMQSEYVITYTSPAKLRDGINRSLSVSIADKESPTSSDGKPVKYNPGGLVPEVASPASWGVFLAVLAGLAFLLLIPILVRWLFSLTQGKGQGKGKIKLAPVKKRPKIKLKS